MSENKKTKEQLIKELAELREENTSLKAKIGSTIGKEADIAERKRAEEALHEEKVKRDAELIIANKELAFQNEEKVKRADELDIANLELDFQSEEKEKRAAELIIANKELAFQNEVKEERAAKLIIANKELVLQHNEKEKRAAKLIIANKELAFQNEEKQKRADELIIANKELAFQNEEKEKRAAELIIANKELAFQNEEKEKRAAELVRNKQLLDETGRLARVGGWEIDLRKNELVWTDVTKMIHEVEQDYIPSLETAINFYVPEAIPIISENVRCAIGEGKSFDVELQLITAKKNRIWVRAIGQAYHENGEIVKIGGVFQDINERKLADEEIKKHREHLEELVHGRTVQLESAIENLERSNKELEQFAYVASHDLQEPLRMVSSFTQLLAKKYKDSLDADAHEYIKFAVEGAIRMQLLINDLLEYSRVGTRGKPFVQVDCYSLLGIVRRNLQSRIEETHALVTNDDLPVIMADENQLIRLFQNLIDNAIKFHGDSTPAVHISAKETQGEWVFSVSDNGMGIKKEYFETIFVIFQRLHGRDEFSGTGIGLSVAKKIVTRHGGKIWLESEPDKGTTFYFTIPKMKVKERIV